jgi:hypothetical protein
MTGWSNVTVRFEEEQHADALQEDVAAAESDGLRISHNATLGRIARFRLVGYNMEERALSLLEAAGPIETALLASFNDTSDSGYIEAYRGDGRGLERVSAVNAPEVGRWNFELTVDGLTETGLRAGNDFSLEEKYGDSGKDMVPVDDVKEMIREYSEMMETDALVMGEE